MKDGLTPRQRWLALYILCTGVLMIVLDTTAVTVALPSIQADLGFSSTSLVTALWLRPKPQPAPESTPAI